MEIALITIGRSSIPFVREGIGEYIGRLKRYTPFSMIELPDVKKGSRTSGEQQKIAEGKSILSVINSSDCVILLDEKGRQYSSVEFASFLQKKMASGLKRLVFIIGGPYGFSEEVYGRADTLLSLSRMTFNHEMVRLFFTEQIYRAMTILRGEPYHHE